MYITKNMNQFRNRVIFNKSNIYKIHLYLNMHLNYFNNIFFINPYIINLHYVY
jgi:hypothetical protein